MLRIFQQNWDHTINKLFCSSFFKVDLFIVKITYTKKSIQIKINKFLQSEHTYVATIQAKKRALPALSTPMRNLP